MSSEIKSYKDLMVWQKAIDLVVAIYETLKRFPREELYGLSDQIKRSAVSVPSNTRPVKIGLEYCWDGLETDETLQFNSFIRRNYLTG